HRAALDPLRELYGRVFQHPAAAGQCRGAAAGGGAGPRRRHRKLTAYAPPAQPIEISIRASGALSYIDRDLSSAERPLKDRDELLEVIKSKQAKKPNQPVVI